MAGGCVHYGAWRLAAPTVPDTSVARVTARRGRPRFRFSPRVPLIALSQTMKNDIHPKYYPNCKVMYRGEHVMTVGATVPEMSVEIWSGSHPFFTGKSAFVDTAGRVEKFQKKFAGGYFKKPEKKSKKK